MTKIAGYPFTSYKIKFVLCINVRVHCAELSLYVYASALLSCKLYICNLYVYGTTIRYTRIDVFIVSMSSYVYYLDCGRYNFIVSNIYVLQNVSK